LLRWRAGAALALAGVIFVLLAVTLLIANALPLWVSSLIVGVVCAIRRLCDGEGRAEKSESGLRSFLACRRFGEKGR
jgi:hypothetical protein